MIHPNQDKRLSILVFSFFFFFFEKPFILVIYGGISFFSFYLLRPFKLVTLIFFKKKKLVTFKSFSLSFFFFLIGFKSFSLIIIHSQSVIIQYNLSNVHENLT